MGWIQDRVGIGRAVDYSPGDDRSCSSPVCPSPPISWLEVSLETGWRDAWVRRSPERRHVLGEAEVLAFWMFERFKSLTKQEI